MTEPAKSGDLPGSCGVCHHWTADGDASAWGQCGHVKQQLVHMRTHVDDEPTSGWCPLVEVKP